MDGTQLKLAPWQRPSRRFVPSPRGEDPHPSRPIRAGRLRRAGDRLRPGAERKIGVFMWVEIVRRSGLSPKAEGGRSWRSPNRARFEKALWRLAVNAAR